MDALSMINRTNGVMVDVIASSAVDRGFPVGSNIRLYNWECMLLLLEPWQLKGKRQDGFAQNQENVSGCSDTTNVSTRWLLFEWASTIKIQLKRTCLE